MKFPVKLLGLIGYPLEHSFSERYFNEKFSSLGYDFIEYRNFPLEDIEELPDLLDLFPEICGFNVTIPHKRSVMKFLDGIDEVAEQVGAVNTVVVKRDGEEIRLLGYNTDVIGFEQSLVPLLDPHHRRALILGTGGAAQAVAYVLERLGIDYAFVSRRSNARMRTFLYSELNGDILSDYQIIINTTPLGMYPHTHLYPAIPYEDLGQQHLLYDLIYNPAETEFLRRGRVQGAKISNGLEMLYKQADAAWEIFHRAGCFMA